MSRHTSSCLLTLINTSVRQEEEPEPITNLIFLDDEVFSNFGEVIDTTDAS